MSQIYYYFIPMDLKKMIIPVTSSKTGQLELDLVFKEEA